ncbi:hypothetical protein SETIT_2G126400v2 [Setaria italica]|uniref:Uncharacterized protein n=1 Tax=Setaria italica TaxID=4555 RepID=A0A368PYP5_SETIT|nr:hypothetical protein SETIT_2G126400v2 [Setaria italica]
MSNPLLRLLLPLLLLLLPPPLREYFSASHRPKDAGFSGELHPVVLVPGQSCSDLEARLTEAYKPSAPRCGAMKGNGWFGLVSRRASPTSAPREGSTVKTLFART